MSPNGTAAYDAAADLPPLVERAVSLARQAGFANSCRPEHGRLLLALAAGAEVIGETGTGCGVGLAWLVSGAQPGARLISVELNAGRAERAAQLFSGMPRVTVIAADWAEIYLHGPFDLLVLDGGAHGKPGPSAVRAAPWSSTILPRPATGRPGTSAESMRLGWAGWITPGLTRPSYGWPPTWPPWWRPAGTLRLPRSGQLSCRPGGSAGHQG